MFGARLAWSHSDSAVMPDPARLPGLSHSQLPILFDLIMILQKYLSFNKDFNFKHGKRDFVDIPIILMKVNALTVQ